MTIPLFHPGEHLLKNFESWRECRRTFSALDVPTNRNYRNLNVACLTEIPALRLAHFFSSAPPRILVEFAESLEIRLAQRKSGKIHHAYAKAQRFDT